MRKQRVAYFYDEDIGTFLFTPNHAMKPHRIRMTHHLCDAYGLLSQMRCIIPRKATFKDLTRFHTDEYIRFLSEATPMNVTEDIETRFNVGADSPVIDGVFEYVQKVGGGSIEAAKELCSGKADIAIHWAGGMHHAKKEEAGGFCYVNDCVLAILNLLDRFQRVLYIDIDVHHGDGVEEAFYSTDRVLTLSFHKYGDFFPYTGDIKDIGYAQGKYYAVNVPLKNGIDDESYDNLFDYIVEHIVSWYSPNAVVLQCGADSLAGDRLGCFNLSIEGHAHCVRKMASFGIPLILLGGGGYTLRNVATCWTSETAAILGVDISNDIPYNEFLHFYGPEYTLNVNLPPMTNQNTPEFINQIIEAVTENLRHLPGAPCIFPLGDKLHVIDEWDNEDDFDERIIDRFISSRMIEPETKQEE